jgi:nucleotide-binding universal stress UspA family protein
MFTRILVPLDGSLLSHQALPYARRIARCGGGELLLLHVTPAPVGVASTPEAVAAEMGEHVRAPGRPFEPSPADRMFIADSPRRGDVRIEREVEFAAQELDRFEAELKSEGFVAHSIVHPGAAAESILDVARAENADLIVMSTHGRGGFGRFLLGSVADKVVRHTDVPVMLVRARDVHAEAPDFKRILVPLDGSQVAAAVLPAVRDLARCASSEIVLLRVTPGEPAAPLPLAPLPEPTAELADARAAQPSQAAEKERAATAYVQSMQQSADHWGVPVRTLVQVGDPASVILDTAQDLYVDLIAMSTHGLGGLRRFFLGSVAERVVRHAEAPVLLFRIPEQE